MSLVIIFLPQFSGFPFPSDAFCGGKEYNAFCGGKEYRVLILPIYARSVLIELTE